jgi:uncharacterized membrane protein
MKGGIKVVNKLLGALLAIVVGVAMLPTITDTINTLDTTSLPSAVVSLVDLLPILFVVIIVAGAVSYIRFKE